MKTAKLKEAVENAQTFGEVFDLMEVFYESKNHNFSMMKRANGWLCRVMKVSKVVDGKEVKYKESFVFEETGATFEEAFKAAANTYLK